MRILLLGAGFSRNWGGWLASELSGDLLGSINDPLLRKMLQDTHAFEDVLSNLQRVRQDSVENEQRYRDLEDAIRTSFRRMNLLFADSDFRFNFSQFVDRDIGLFLSKFDAIFTLNQDLLLELRYLTPLGYRFHGAHYPGLRSYASQNESYSSIDLQQRLALRYEPADSTHFTVNKSMQPIYKLHGSVDWVCADHDLMILGAQKADAIHDNALLAWYYNQFRDALNRGNTRLMVIGYSFQDLHINDLIWTGAEHHGLSMFLVDPVGARLLQTDIGLKTRWMSSDIPLIGISQRPLSSTFADDKLEHGKLMRFFQ